MNRAGLLVAVLQACAAAEAAWARDWQRAIIWAAFAVGSAGVAWR